MKKMLIFVDTKNNNNKFYSLELVGSDVFTEWGRVGNEKSQKKTLFNVGEAGLNKKLNEKIKKGYSISDIDTEIEEEDLNSSKNLLDIVMSQVITDLDSKELLKRLVEKNIHNITSNTKIKYDIKTGYFKTPLGIVTSIGVNKAIGFLNEMKSLIKNGRFDNSQKDNFIILNEKYFIQIPTKIAKLRDFNNLLITEERINAQIDICDALLESITIINDEKEKIKNSKNGIKIKEEKIFDTSVEVLKDKKEFKRIVDYYENSKNRNHGYSNNNAKITNIYKISLEKEKNEYRDNLSNEMELFHGTKVANLLSILKGGLLMPKYSPGETTGYMYGMGLYFASQSTKSQNYCDGGHWNSCKKENKIYMFIADVAMGNYEIPKSWSSKIPKKGYDSFWAKSGKSGVMNDEMIIFNNNQIRLKYILEIEI